MASSHDTIFHLPDGLAAKADAALVADDDQHFDRIGRSLATQVGEHTARLDEARKRPTRGGTEALERDQEVHHLTSRLALLRRFGVDLCLGRMVTTDGERVYVGRLGLHDAGGERLMVDWRSPVAEPFFGATHADPMGLASRRRYRWSQGRITDYWDEAFTQDGLESSVALDDQSAFIASLGTSRSERMRDVLGTIQSDQDAIIRAGSSGALVIDGGPGTGKTVVALHRTAYLLYSDPRLGHRRGGVLFVGPHAPYLAYVADVLPSLGEEGVQTCTVRDLVPEGRRARAESDPEVARLKAGVELLTAIEPAVALYEEAPTQPLSVETPWADVRLASRDWAEAFAAAEPGVPHNVARDQVWDALVAIVADRVAEALGDVDDDPEAERGPSDGLRRSLDRNRDLRETFDRAWTIVEPTDLVADLWTVPAYLQRCAPWLSDQQVQLLQRDDGYAWTEADLPLLDAARLRLGDPDASARRRRQQEAVAVERDRMSRVVDDLIATDDSELMLMSMLRGDDLKASLDDAAVAPDADPDLLAGPFAHVVVDEAQELTDAEWQMLLVRCPSRSLTIVGDRAQARHGFAESWAERLARIGLDQVELASLTINYRTPAEVMSEAEPVIRAALPDANVPTSIRSTGEPVTHGDVAELEDVLTAWLESTDEGTACVIARAPSDQAPADPRVRTLTPTLAKGLEFDLVVLVDPETFGTGIAGAVDRYVAMTRATQRLVVLTSPSV
ncbi:RNA polymerase recycling motor ATPase HelR [Aeromicrobium sp. Leaf350]|uniref:RNA polymerase recycling motor ATPase HelR n=1 Tax=Aeromicrobium sp. Leaf350 TaxID=2876565 RepID=UPI001E2F834D|nr:RNA polymerase recycling motor ATPase HelR [Aeromicrobium sp. Leaf350]